MHCAFVVWNVCVCVCVCAALKGEIGRESLDKQIGHKQHQFME